MTAKLDPSPLAVPVNGQRPEPPAQVAVNLNDPVSVRGFVRNELPELQKAIRAADHAMAELDEKNEVSVATTLAQIYALTRANSAAIAALMTGEIHLVHQHVVVKEKAAAARSLVLPNSLGGRG